jgi:hypothetical protein
MFFTIPNLFLNYFVQNLFPNQHYKDTKCFLQFLVFFCLFLPDFQPVGIPSSFLIDLLNRVPLPKYPSFRLEVEWIPI